MEVAEAWVVAQDEALLDAAEVRLACRRAADFRRAHDDLPVVEKA